MTPTCKSLSIVAAIVVIFGAQQLARADAVTSNTLSVFGSFGVNQNDTVAGGVFTFVIPAGHTITAVSLTGNEFNSLTPDGSFVLLNLDGNFVYSITPLGGGTINVPINPGFFSTFTDGTSTLTLSRHGSDYTDLSQYSLLDLRLNITTAQVTAPVPEPTTILLLGSGLVGIAAKVRTRRKSV